VDVEDIDGSIGGSGGDVVRGLAETLTVVEGVLGLEHERAKTRHWFGSDLRTGDMDGPYLLR
jgi:hypothetical protein